MNLGQLLVRMAKADPGAEAVSLGRTRLYDYAAFARRAAALAEAFQGRFGLCHGDRVALFMANRPEYLEIMYGAWMAGLAVVPINAKLHPQELRYILEDSGTSVLFVDEASSRGLGTALAGLRALKATLHPASNEYARLLARDAALSPVARDRDDLAWLFYTSGTTGRPKGVMLSHGNLLAMALAYFADVDSVARSDAMIYAAPLSHGAGLYNLIHVLAGARHVVPESGGFDAAEFFELANHHRQACAFAAPTIVKRLVDHVESTGTSSEGVKTIVYGGGPMYVADIKRALAVMGNRFVQIYGQGESPMTISCLARHHLAASEHPRFEDRIASVGIAQCVVEVRVADEEDRSCATGEPGEILVRGAPVMRGYWNDRAATESALRGGWLHTGDVGVLDEDAFLTLRDRSKDMIVSGGSNIYPREVEEVLLRCPDVAEAAVVGRVHPEWGEEVVAFVVPRVGSSVSAATLDQLCLRHIARFKRPRAYRFVAALPKNNYGKVLKTVLREQLVSEDP